MGVHVGWGMQHLLWRPRRHGAGPAAGHKHSANGTQLHGRGRSEGNAAAIAVMSSTVSL